MGDKSFSYSVAIRTLGKAGEKYQRLLDSLLLQECKPDKIIVYIADGYDTPKETIGIEEYVFVPKGMIAQRALDYKEIDSEYILLLDDDVCLKPDSVSILKSAIVERRGDFVAANTFQTSHRGLKNILRDSILNFTFTHNDQDWGIKVLKSSTCSLNNKPTSNVVRTQSAAGPASLWKKSSFIGICFEDEKWLDQFSYPLGDDQVMFYKAHINGYKGYLCYECGISHLDAQTQQRSFNADKHKYRSLSALRFIIWYRSVYEVSTSLLGRVGCIFVYMFYVALMMLVKMLSSIKNMNFTLFYMYICGQIDGIRYIQSSEYKIIPKMKLK